MLLIKNLVIDGQDSAIEADIDGGDFCEDARNNMVLSRSLFDIL